MRRSVSPNRPVLGELRPPPDHKAYAVSPAVVFELPVVAADAPLLDEELKRTLQRLARTEHKPLERSAGHGLPDS